MTDRRTTPSQAAIDCRHALDRARRHTEHIGIQGLPAIAAIDEARVALDDFVGEYTAVLDELDDLRPRVEAIEDSAGAGLSEVDQWRRHFGQRQHQAQGE